MRNRKKLIIGIVLLLIILVGIIYLYFNKEYKYVCLNIEITEGTIIIDEYLDECVTKKRIDKNVIVDKEMFVNQEYQYIGDNKAKGEMLYLEEFVLWEMPKSLEQEINLLTELEIVDHGNGSEDMETYRLYIENEILYAHNKDTDEVRKIFDTEKVKNIALRGLCCAGDSRMLILTTSGNVYISIRNATYDFSFDKDFPFDKLGVSNVVGFKLIPATDYDSVKDLYVIDINGNEIKIDDSNYRF